MSKEANKIYAEKHFNILPGHAMSIDKVSFLLPTRGLNKHNLEYYKKKNRISIIDITKGKHIQYHAECFKSDQSMTQSIFDEMQSNYYSSFPLYDREITMEEIIQEWTLAIVEIAFDFQHKVFPFYVNFTSKSFRAESFKTKRDTTIYSRDARVILPRLRSKTTSHRSLICIYDRTAKLKAVLPKEEWYFIPENLTRYEFRLAGRYLSGAKAVKSENPSEAFEEIKAITTKDLQLTPLGFIRRIKRTLIAFTKMIIKPHSIWFINSLIYKSLQPFLYTIFLECSLKPLKRKDLE